MSGRAKRMVERPDGRVELADRSEGMGCANQAHLINARECAHFQAGHKLVAVITAAASSGISLHADRAAANQRQRVMLVGELTWQADDTMQQFGRVHRSNQLQPPHYEIVVMRMGGEARFISDIVRKLRMMGALLKGGREAAVAEGKGAESFSEQSFFDTYGEAAMRKLAATLARSQAQFPGELQPAPCVAEAGAVDLVLQRSSCGKIWSPRVHALVRAYLEYSMADFCDDVVEALDSVGIERRHRSAC